MIDVCMMSALWSRLKPGGDAMKEYPLVKATNKKEFSACTVSIGMLQQ